MADQALSNAQLMRKSLIEKRNSLQAQILELDREIGRVDKFIKEWHLFSDISVQDGDHVLVIESKLSGNKTDTESDSAPRVRNSSKEEVAAAAREIIRDNGKPMSREELFGRLTEKGLVIQGKNPEMVLSTMLWRMRDTIVRLPKDGYWLREEPYPSAVYYPELEPMSGVADDTAPEGSDDDLLV